MAGTILLDVTPCIQISDGPEDGGNTFLRNIDTRPPAYTESHPTEHPKLQMKKKRMIPCSISSQ
jgi:hypothetical protein